VQKFRVWRHNHFVEVGMNSAKVASQAGLSHVEAEVNQQISHIQTAESTDLQTLISPPGFAGFGPPINTVKAQPVSSAILLQKERICHGHVSIALENHDHGEWLSSLRVEMLTRQGLTYETLRLHVWQR
jgi:hypothetical protein